MDSEGFTQEIKLIIGSCFLFLSLVTIEKKYCVNSCVHLAPILIRCAKKLSITCAH